MKQQFIILQNASFRKIKMKKMLFSHEIYNLSVTSPPKPFSTRRLNKLWYLIKMNPFLVHYHRKIEQKLCTAN